MSDTQDEETNNGDYENITYRTFKAVEYDRVMRWRAGTGSGRIVVGGVSQNTNKPNETEGVALPAWKNVVVLHTEFKLSKT